MTRLLFQNKYRIPSIRLRKHDYASSGYYFITICTKNKKCLFGNITNNIMRLNDIGKIARKHWLEIPNHFPSVILDEFVIMPNHIHGILIIKHIETPNLGVSTNTTTCKKIHLGLIINQYKRICTMKIKQNYNFFAWQTRFYDRIIWNNISLENTRQYIRNNPYKWYRDRNNF